MIKNHLRTALLVSFVVGVILNLVNSYGVIMKLQFTMESMMKITFTFLVPFSVSVYSSWRASKK